MATDSTSRPAPKIYLGDGAYCEFTGYGIKLTAENGVYTTDSIWLEEEHITRMLAFYQAELTKWQAELKKHEVNLG